MKVGLDVSAVPPRPAGAGRYIVELARRLPSVGVEVSLAARRSDGERWRTIDGVQHVDGVVPNGRAARLAFEAFVLGGTRIARSVDVWHGPHYTMPHRAMTPVVVTVHDMTFFTNPEWHERAKVAFFTRAIRYAAEHASVIVAVSEFTAREIRAICPTKGPIVVAPHGVDLDRFTPNGGVELQVGSQLPDMSRPYVLFVGTFEPRKGIDVLLGAFEVMASSNSEVELWLAGQEGWGVERVNHELATHPFASRIRRLGYVADELLPTLIRRATVVAYPSRGEGFGLPVLEAMACAVPVVTSADTVMAEVAGDGARCTPVGDVAALAAALTELAHLTDAERLAIGSRARARAEQFTWANTIERHIEAYTSAQRVG